jgi:hypothetical protein
MMRTLLAVRFGLTAVRRTRVEVIVIDHLSLTPTPD